MSLSGTPWRTWPGYKHISTLETSYSAVVQVLDVEPLIPEMFSKNVINREMKELLEVTPTKLYKARKFMDYLIRKDWDIFKTFMVILLNRQEDTFITLMSFFPSSDAELARLA